MLSIKLTPSTRTGVWRCGVGVTAKMEIKLVSAGAVWCGVVACGIECQMFRPSQQFPRSLTSKGPK